ncbi:MAG: hypothetical protein ACYC46_00080 [Acidobacteriaceae bacterium]
MPETGVIANIFDPDHTASHRNYASKKSLIGKSEIPFEEFFPNKNFTGSTLNVYVYKWQENLWTEDSKASTVRPIPAYFLVFQEDRWPSHGQSGADCRKNCIYRKNCHFPDTNGQIDEKERK